MTQNPINTTKCSSIERAAGRREMPNFIFAVKGFKPSSDGEIEIYGEHRTWFYSAEFPHNAREYAERDGILIRGDIVREGRTPLEAGRAYTRSEIENA